ncbi:MAG TPA: TIGR03088 family PEP-CTERM/XrtA system glycosyltransferase [Methylomirabilota bacterium]|nr:TIGR03088 family PEP-CTERM/XrtA system glycosyltransferase [Methylomirabilota bacterium]
MSASAVVAHVVNSLSTGGLENGVVNVANDPKSSFRHVVICMTTSGPLAARLNSDVRVLSVGKRDGHDPRAVVRLVRLLQRIAPDIVHSRNWATFDAVLAGRVARVSAIVHGEHGRDVADPQGRNRRRNRIRRLLSPLVTRFVTVSDDLRRWLVEDVRVRANKVRTIYNGVEHDRFADASRAEAREELRLSRDALVLGTVGRLDPVKDQGALVRAFAAIIPRHPEAVLLIAGDGPCREELTNLVRSMGLDGRVRLLGERRDIPSVLASLDLFLLPSIAEGMSNTVLEAMATGLPVVATRVGGNPELVEEGVTGRLVPPRDHEALVGAMNDYLDDPHLRERHGKASSDRSRRHFSIERMRRQYEDLYCELLASTRRSA